MPNKHQLANVSVLMPAQARHSSRLWMIVGGIGLVYSCVGLILLSIELDKIQPNQKIPFIWMTSIFKGIVFGSIMMFLGFRWSLGRLRDPRWPSRIAFTVGLWNVIDGIIMIQQATDNDLASSLTGIGFIAVGALLIQSRFLTITSREEYLHWRSARNSSISRERANRSD